MSAKFEIKKTSAGKFMFNLKAANGEVILTSQSYAAKANALGGVESVKTNGAKEDRFEKKEAKSGEPYFVLLAANGEPLGKSEMYGSAASMNKGIASVMKSVLTATVEDMTAAPAKAAKKPAAGKATSKPKAAARPKSAKKASK